MEKYLNQEGGENDIEQREKVIDRLLVELGQREEMDPADILSDIITFAPYDGNESVNLEYLAEVVERMGVSLEEMSGYAVRKAQDQENEI
jgi:hypothetical protein